VQGAVVDRADPGSGGYRGAGLGRVGDALELSVEVPVADVKGTFTPAAMPGFDVIRVGIGGSLMPAGTTSGNVQQFGSKSAVPPPGQVNPSVTQPVGSWK